MLLDMRRVVKKGVNEIHVDKNECMHEINVKNICVHNFFLLQFLLHAILKCAYLISG
jgi:hypothetical protein